VKRTEVRFTKPSGMKIAWYAPGPDGRAGFSTTPIETPGRYNFLQGAVYRLKLSNIDERVGLEVYPTLEVVPCNPRTGSFLAHSAVPVEFTPDDFDQIARGNYVVKVIYLPDPQFQELAQNAPGEISSTQLEPGQDPIQEARRRGSILLVIRMGNIDLEAPNTPAMDAPGPFNCPPGGMPPFHPGMGVGPAGPGAGPMMPYGMGPGPFPGPMGNAAVPPGLRMGPAGQAGRLLPPLPFPSSGAPGAPTVPTKTTLPGPQSSLTPQGVQPAGGMGRLPDAVPAPRPGSEGSGAASLPALPPLPPLPPAAPAPTPAQLAGQTH
jgi:hypothetical protein